MNLLRTIVSEIVGLFVDDWAFAVLLVAWVLLQTVLTPRLSPAVAAPLFFAGIAAVTLVFVARKARSVRR